MTDRRIGRQMWLKVALLWAALCVIFFWDVLGAQADQIVAGNDLSNMFRLWLDYSREQIHAGRLPLWNPFLSSGSSMVADPQPALFYPPTWLALVMPSTRALGILLVVHIWWAAVGATVWLREEGASWAGALAGAAVLAFSGYTFARIQAGHIGVLTTGSWLSWGLWALRRTRDGPGSWGRRFAYLALTVGLAFLAGHTATFVYVTLFLGVYALYLARGDWRFLVTAAASVGLGLILAAVQLLPLAEAAVETTRLSAVDYEFASRFSWPVGYLITLLVPNFFGEPVRTGYWGEGVYDELILYAGILPLIVGLLMAGRKRGRFWAATSGIAILLAFGSYGVLHQLVFRFVPLFSSLRAPARAGILVIVGAAALTALGMTKLERSTQSERDHFLDPFNGTLIGWTLGGTALVVMTCYLLYAWGRDSSPAAGRFWHLASQVAAFGLFFGLSAVWLRAWRRETVGRLLPYAGLALIILDLWSLGAGLVEVVPAPHSAYWRIISQHTRAEAGRVLPWGLSIFEQNGGLPFGVKSVFGYNPLEDVRYNDFVAVVPDPRARAYDLLNVRYVSTAAPLELRDEDTLSLLTQESGVYIYERETALPRAWLLTHLEAAAGAEALARINEPAFDPGQQAIVEPGATCSSAAGQTPGQVRLERDEAMHLTLRTSGQGGLVVLSERYAPGWEAKVDGESVPILRVDTALRGICVPAGSHSIEMTYRPHSLILGASITGLGLILCLVLVFWPARRRSLFGDLDRSEP